MPKIQPMLDFNENPVYFFYFVTWISLFFLTFLVVFTTILARKSWKPKWYSCSAKKKINHLVPQLGRRFALRFGLRSGPRAQPSHQVVSIFFFALHEYHFGFQDFLAKIVVNTTKKVKKNDETRSQNKKNRHGFY